MTKVARVVPNVTFVVTDVAFVKPNVTFVVPDATFVKPNVTFVVLDATFVEPNVTFVVLDATFVKPNVTFVVPDATFVDPNVTFVVLDATFVEPNVTFVVLDATFVEPSVTFVKTEAAFFGSCADDAIWSHARDLLEDDVGGAIGQGTTTPMNPVRIALANLRFPATREESVALAVEAIGSASAAGAALVAFPECFVPGYRAPGRQVPPPDAEFLEKAWSAIAVACAKGRIAAVVGTERIVDGALRIATLVVNADGGVAGFQDKVQMAPEEDDLYTPGSGRRVFQAGPLTFGVAICHEGWRYPETVRLAVRRGAHLVVHPHFHWAEPGDYVPSTFADPANTFHEKAMLCRAAENTCYMATINFATPACGTTSAVIRPDGTLLAYQPYGKHGLLVADIDLDAATGFLASRCKTAEYRD